ncbi:phosphate acetyltransferase [Peptococcaceae bacterium CEB3]|nr:phosphate acetyltransferase [Peptococcaceae bacterium CEB3]
MRFTGLEVLLERAQSLGRARVVVAAAADRQVLEAVKMARQAGLIDPILVGQGAGIEDLSRQIGLDLGGAELIDEPDPVAAAHRAVDAVAAGRAHFLMKGLVNTADFLRAVLRAEDGLRSGRLLSHLAAISVPGFNRLLFLTDGGINISPTLEQKREIMDNALDCMHRIGMEEVKVVALSANEVPSAKMVSSTDAAALAEMGARGEFPGAVVDGPLALDGAISAAALKHKGIKSRVNGDADLFLVPTIEVGNAVIKSMLYFAGATFAGIILGAKTPIVMTSRNDSPRSKLMSIAFAAVSREAGL